MINISNTNRLYVVLLLKDEAKHGYQLIKDIERLTGEKPSTAHVYPFLEELSDHGLIETVDTGGRGKNVYGLTEKGEDVVDEQVRRFGEILSVAIEGDIRECIHCGCKVYADGYEEDGDIYCCEHCADHAANK